MMIKYLIEKEFKQLVRNSFLPKLILIFPSMMLLLMPWAANMEVKDVRLAVVDGDHSPLSRRLVEKVGASDNFRTVAFAPTYDEALRLVEVGTADVVLEIPRGFERRCVRAEGPTVLIAANAVNGTKGGLGSSYLSAIVASFAAESLAPAAGNSLPARWQQPASTVATACQDGGNSLPASAQGLPTVRVETQNLFNPTLNYKHFIIPALMVMLTTLMCGFLPSLNVVAEKEVGTIEQINVTPVPKFTFIVAKLVPYWLIGLTVLSICFVLSWALYGFAPAGSVWVIYAHAVVFLLVVSGFGLVISNHAATMQQAMFIMFFFLLLFILMSGLFTPIRSMPRWAQVLTWVNPLRYFVEVMRGVYLRGSGFADLLPQLGALLAFALAANLWAVRSYKKQA